jgi:indole-3-glycerol phosphate synthase
MDSLLDRIFENKKSELPSVMEKMLLNKLTETKEYAETAIDFLSAFKNNETSNIIAEIKYKSPIQGNYGVKSTVEDIANDYKMGGASAISVLTDKEYFDGDIDYLRRVRTTVDLPILRKDFIFDTYQIHEAKAYGADAFLLIADYLGRVLVKELIETGRELSIEPLVEVHSEESLLEVVDLPFNLLGINNRNLKTGNVDIRTTFNILERCRDKLKNKKIISESGINSRDEIISIEEKGVNGFLIGTSLMLSSNRKQKLKELMGS